MGAMYRKLMQGRDTVVAGPNRAQRRAKDQHDQRVQRAGQRAWDRDQKGKA
jgi:hypothetical protein